MSKILPILCLLTILSSCMKEIERPIVTNVSLDKTTLEIKIGDTYQFKTSYLPSSAKAPELEWECTGDSRIGSITQDGLFTAKAKGQIKVRIFANITNPDTGTNIEATCDITVNPISAQGVKLDSNEITLNPGESKDLICSISPNNADTKEIVWKSSNESIAQLSGDGKTATKVTVTAVGSGEATISVSLSGKTAYCKVKVNPSKLEKLEFDEKEKEMTLGETLKLTPVFIPVYATNKNIKCKSSDENIAIVDIDGNVKAVSLGKCVIKATSEDGGLEATCEITVKPVPVESITFDTYSYNVEIGGQRQLSVTILPEGARDTKIKWSSSNTTVAPIDENGLVRGNTSGSTVITATTEDGHTATCNVYAVDIDQMMEIYFPSSSLAIINGFYTGSITCAIKNNSSQTVKLTRFYVIDTNTFKTVAETSDKSLLGNELKPGQTIALSGRFNSVYEPGFFWEMEYNGRTFKTYQKYGNKSSRSIKIEDTGKAKELISLTRIQ